MGPSSSNFVNCAFVGNSALKGGGLYGLNGAGVTLQNCTFNDNTSPHGSGLTVEYNGSLQCNNSIIAFGTGAEAIAVGENSSATLSCTDIYGNAGGDWVGYIAPQENANNNFSADPMFCNDWPGDLRLHEQSPCAPGAGVCGQVGTHGVGCGPSCCVLRGDIDHEGGTVTISDLVYLINYMFQSGPEPFCMEEANLDSSPDGLADISDLIYLVDFMFRGGPPPGPCPE